MTRVLVCKTCGYPVEHVEYDDDGLQQRYGYRCPVCREPRGDGEVERVEFDNSLQEGDV